MQSLEILDLLKKLISENSVTPQDGQCQKIIAERLKKLNFEIEPMRFGNVDNLWARYGNSQPLLVFAGHTDVVPPGPLEHWDSPPFEPRLHDGKLYGRGACDMKSGLVCMLIAAENFIRANPKFTGSIAFLITSDEEGPSINGTQKVIAELIKRKIQIDYCIVGEATGENKLGDQIRIGRRGSLHGKLLIQGKQGHIAYPDIAINPIHQCLLALDALCKEIWDQGNDFFPPTSMQVSNLHSGTGAANVIPGTLEALFNFRFSTAVTVPQLMERTQSILKKFPINFTIDWDLSGEPFLTSHGKLIQATQVVIRDRLNCDPKLSTGGGTSDGRFIAKTGAEVIELGPTNTSAHQVNEYVEVDELEKLAEVYEEILVRIFNE